MLFAIDKIKSGQNCLNFKISNLVINHLSFLVAANNALIAHFCEMLREC